MKLVHASVGVRPSSSPNTRASRRRRDGIASPTETLEGRLLLATFTVTTTADAGAGSLRQAIIDANAAAGTDEIRFDLPPTAGVVKTIRPLSALPGVTGPTTIDGRTQPGFVGKPVVFLDGVLAGDFADGLQFSNNGGGPSVVRSVAIGRFGRHGINVTQASSSSSFSVFGSHIGVDPDGDVAMGNGGAGVRVAAAAPVNIGGAAAGDRNVISANRLAGVEIVPTNSTTVTVNVRGNYIGTNAAGTGALGNGREGVYVGDNVRSVVIGGEGGNGNVISGNMASGVRVAAGTMVTIQGNRIGTDAFGGAAVPNGQSASSPYRNGVTATDPQTLLVGGATAALRNQISGNVGDGVALILGPTPRSQNAIRVQGNFIGTDATGGGAVANGGDGVAVIGAPGGPAIGPMVTFNGPITGNLISGNVGDGVSLLNVQTVTVAGNFIGVRAQGDAPLGNGGNGVDVTDSLAILGGTATTPPPTLEVNPASAGRNVISANGGHGIHGLSSQVTVINSYVGTSSSGNAALGNGGHGVFLERSSGGIGVGIRVPTLPPTSGNVISANRGNGITVVGPTEASPSVGMVTIGANRIGVAAGNLDDARLGNAGHGVLVVNHTNVRVGDSTITNSGNVIAYNGGSGVSAEGRETIGTTPPSTAVGINGNSIFSNGGLGIDLVSMNDGVSGVTPNDNLDADNGPNGLLNHPTLFSAVQAGGGTRVTFRVDAVGSRTYRVEFFSSPSPDPTGFGEGRTFLGFQNVTGTTATQTANLPAVPAGSYITATSTDVSPSPMTSEFSPAVTLGPPATAPEVRGRYVFYNLSAFDGGTIGASPADDAAIATEKRALLPGQTPTAANVISYDKGINGIMIDVPTLPSGPGPNSTDFVVRVGNSADPGSWAPGPQPIQYNLRRGAGAGGGDRITLSWSTIGVARNQWMEVTVLPSSRTGLSMPDTFYFGNLTGETGAGGGGTPSVSPADYGATRAAIGTTDATVLNRFDHNRDGNVSPADLALVRANLGRTLATPYATNLTTNTSDAPLAPASVWEELQREE